MSAPKDGGSAFPAMEFTPAPFYREGASPSPSFQPGMSMRDWFAGQLLAGWAAGRDQSLQEKNEPEHVSETCYRYADAMLKERAK